MSRSVHVRGKVRATKLVILCMAAVGCVALTTVAAAKPTVGVRSSAAETSSTSDLYRSIDTRTEELLDTGAVIPATLSLHQPTGHSAIPDVAIVNISFSKADVRKAIETLVKGTPLRVTVVGGDDRFGTISAKNVSGQLPVVLSNLAETMGFFYTVSNDTLIVSAEQNFTVNVESGYSLEQLSELSDMLQALGAQLIRKEPHGNALVYRANRRAYLRVTQALQGKKTSNGLSNPMTSVDAGSSERTVKRDTQPLLVASLAPVEVTKEQRRADPAATSDTLVAKRTEPQPAQSRSITVETHGVPAVAVPQSASAIQTWRSTKSDKTIQSTLERWAKSVGWEVAWEVPRKLPAGFEASFNGPFDLAVEQMMKALRGTDYPIIACLYEANQVLRVVRRGEAKKCED
ncbi:toxin co-regulated pilus biosynthesis Q family protein [Noviherbaspirillum malthae]|uniref:toxin co-regulated pilus biosynthesis Q family protein n=1 Tax=Noviherbaspirillum malthae TaxID=1260987 RepID=UPI00188FA929|nr:toxin co-regulated pilus biosynthesis Q family protein [Noviherbaspirillum malthae]